MAQPIPLGDLAEEVKALKSTVSDLERELRALRSELDGVRNEYKILTRQMKLEGHLRGGMRG